MLEKKETYDSTYEHFEWQIPGRYNIGVDICDKWADCDPERIALIDVGPNGKREKVSFGRLKIKSNQLANALVALGVQREPGKIGDRVGVLLPQCVTTAVAHIAVTKMGCVSIPLFTLFGEEALLHRLRDSGAKAVITNSEGEAKLAAIRDQLPDLVFVLSVDEPVKGNLSISAICENQSEQFVPVDTAADDPAILIYTSGTTGDPKGALHAHRVLLGHLPGVEMSHNFLPEPNDLFWTPADWAWIGGLLDVLMPALHHGIAVVACRFNKFTPEAAFDLIKSHGIRNVFLPPTAIKIMKLHPQAEELGVKLRSVGSGGETLGSELFDWGRKALGTTINEFYGQTECNMVVSSCSAFEPPNPGLMGRPVPGHIVEVIDRETGIVLPRGVEGAIAIKTPDPVMFLGYWNNLESTADKFVSGPDGRWLLTGDRGARDKEGRLFFLGRDDDVIGSAGYRIGPAEVENCLIGHKAVKLAGVVGKPDALRGSVVAAYVMLKDGYLPSDALADDIAQYVKLRLAAYEYPRVVRFIDEMPMTTTGKIIRRKLRAFAEMEAAQEKELANGGT